MDEFWWRLLAGLGIFALIEIVDHYVDAFSFPWWLSLLMAFLLSIPDIIFIFCIGLISGD